MLKERNFLILSLVPLSFILVSCSRSAHFVHAGSECSMYRATKSINPGETITMDSIKSTMEKFKPGENFPAVVRDRAVLLGLRPIKTIPKGELFLNAYFNQEELKSKQASSNKRLLDFS